MEIKDLNPWWKTAKAEEEFISLPRRTIFNEIIDYLDERQIIALHGLRRTGKTVLMHHIIDTLLKKYPSESIFYYNFDLLNDKIENILKTYGKIVGIDIKKEKVFVFLDEIQKYPGWETEIKLLYDTYQNIKFFITGSSSLFIEKKTKESLGGRIYSFFLEPLTFKEYLKLKDIKADNVSLYSDELESELKHYLRTGGFPELLNTTEDIKIDKYIKELIIDRVVYIDIPKVFEIEEPELLARILAIISAEPGMIIDYESLADDLNRNRKTVSNYIFYLEKSFLIKKVYNYSRNLLTSEKKMKKIYPASTAFSFLFNAEQGKIIENLVIMNENFRFFSRVGNKEVDFIKVDKEIMPIEVKYKQKISQNELKGLLRFINKQNLKEGIILTKDKESEEIIKDKKIRYMPLLKYLLSNNPIS